MSYPGRRLPFVVQHGRRGEAPPPYISSLSENRLILGGASPHTGLPSEIPFFGEGPIWENEDLFRKLAALNAEGLPFQYRPKDMDAPVALLGWWQEIGRLTVSFREISWQDPERWLITTIEPPVPGVLGWTGPKSFGC
ncbi:hypothetical protein [Inquilinus sp. OTU3971]|uniref:hypothetical protein n=1 Tax=Inquilinus sp. OTU3971 TaxID=3043855 RepID=UPI00313EDADE